MVGDKIGGKNNWWEVRDERLKYPPREGSTVVPGYRDKRVNRGGTAVPG